MKAIIKYIDFHMDNVQGASGRTIEGNMVLEVPHGLICGEFFEFMHKKLEEYVNQRRPYGRSEPLYKYTILSVELI